MAWSILGISSTFIGAILLALAVLAIFIKSLRPWVKTITFNQITNVGLAIFIVGAAGFLLGGVPVLMNFGASLVPSTSGSIVNPTPQTVNPSATAIKNCVYLSGSGLAGNVTVRTVPDQTTVWTDLKENTGYTASNTYATVNFTCYRTDNVAYAGSVRIYGDSPMWSSENDNTKPAGVYNLFELRTQANSLVNPSQNFQKKFYIAKDAQATTSSNIEALDLSFAAGSPSAVVSVALNYDKATSFAQLNNYSVRTLTMYQQGGSPIFTVNMLKVP